MMRCIHVQAEDMKWQSAIDRGLKHGHDHLQRTNAWDMTRHRDAVDPSREREMVAEKDNRCPLLIDKMKVGNNQRGVKYKKGGRTRGEGYEIGKAQGT